jgi:hypothetical protein
MTSACRAASAAMIRGQKRIPVLRFARAWIQQQFANGIFVLLSHESPRAVHGYGVRMTARHSGGFVA